MLQTALPFPAYLRRTSCGIMPYSIKSDIHIQKILAFINSAMVLYNSLTAQPGFSGAKEVEHLPNIKSQKKRVLTNAKATARNKSIKSNLRTTIKKAESAITDGSKENAEVINGAYSVIDKAVASGVLHKNAAARKKSAIAKKAAAAAAK